VRSEARVEVAACCEAGDEAVVCPGPGSWMTGGGGTLVSRAIEE
jgi:hypothetical protein